MNEPPSGAEGMNSFSDLASGFSQVRRCKRLRRPEGPSLGSVDVRCRCIVPKVGGLVGGIILGSGLPPGTAEAQNFASGGCPALSNTPTVGDCIASLGLAFRVLLVLLSGSTCPCSDVEPVLFDS